MHQFNVVRCELPGQEPGITWKLERGITWKLFLLLLARSNWRIWTGVPISLLFFLHFNISTFCSVKNYFPLSPEDRITPIWHIYTMAEKNYVVILANPLMGE